MKKSVCAVVLTYNRLELLKECLYALLSQTYRIERIFVVNNQSTDGTIEYLNDAESQYRIRHILLDKNYGASYGFNYGVNFACQEEVDYLWIMDDDTIPQNDALEKMMIKEQKLQKENKKIGFLSSKVLWIDGTLCKMNIPSYEDKEKGKVSSASFVSLLVPRKVCMEVGLPIADFYIWCTDVEYTTRIIKKYKYSGFIVEDSIVVHKMRHNLGGDLARENIPERMQRYFYLYRNRGYIVKEYGGKAKYYLQIIKMFMKVLFISKKNKKERIAILINGVKSGIRFNPVIEEVQKDDV